MSASDSERTGESMTESVKQIIYTMSLIRLRAIYHHCKLLSVLLGGGRGRRPLGIPLNAEHDDHQQLANRRLISQAGAQHL